MRPRQNGRHFPDDIFNCIFLNENVWISNKISLKFVPKGQINNIPALVHIMAWCRPGDKPLSEPIIVSLLTHICITRPQWVNIYFQKWHCNMCLHMVGLSYSVSTGGHDAKSSYLHVTDTIQDLQAPHHDPLNVHQIINMFQWSLHHFFYPMNPRSSSDCSGPFYQHDLTLTPAWISNHIHYKMWDEITYPFPNFNSCTVEVWEWISNFIPHFIRHVITYL